MSIFCKAEGKKLVWKSLSFILVQFIVCSPLVFAMDREEELATQIERGSSVSSSKVNTKSSDELISPRTYSEAIKALQNSQGLTNIHDIPESSPCRLNLPILPGFTMPPDPYDVSNFDDLLKEDVAFSQFVGGFRDAANSGSIYAAHGLSLGSLRRIAFFSYGRENIEVVTPQELFRKSPYLTLGRLLVSATLIDLNRKFVPLVQPVGFLFRIQPEQVYTALLGDGNVACEGQCGETQEEFREWVQRAVFTDPSHRTAYESSDAFSQYMADPARLQTYQNDPKISTPYIRQFAQEQGYPLKYVLDRHQPEGPFPALEDILSVEKVDGYNEVSFITHTMQPTTTARLVGVFIGGDAWDNATPLKYGTDYHVDADREWSKSPTWNRELDAIMTTVARDLHLPLIDFRNLQG